MMKELQSLCLDVELVEEQDAAVEATDDAGASAPGSSADMPTAVV